MEATKDVIREKKQQDFINLANSIFGNKYDYSLTEYLNRDKAVVIICPIHGKFRMSAGYHLKGNGCPFCG